MSARYPAVYALLRERMADEGDIPDTDEIIAAALDAARDAIDALHGPGLSCDTTVCEALAAIDALRGES